MQVFRRLTLVAVIVAPVIAAMTLSSPPARAVLPREAADPVARPSGAIRWEGVGSCAASACHGSLSKTASPRETAVTVWTGKDPHAQAYRALRSDRSKKMLVNLRQLSDAKNVHPEADALCLKCHSMGVPRELQGPRFDATEGVACETCHGPAGKWKVIHDLPSWKFLSDDEKAAYGLRNLRNPAIRADACASCHQGSPEREVNHDLIAAGHPALFFDVSAQMDRMPRHWDTAIDRAQPDFSARLWVTGQLMGVRMSMDNLAARAKDNKKPWPEFAEYDCLACHRSPLLNPLPPIKGVRPGQVPYMAWGQPMARVLAPELAPLFDQLAAEMNKPVPDQGNVGKLTAEIIAGIDKSRKELETTSYTKAKVTALMRTIAADGAKQSQVRWFAGTQITTGLTALNKSLLDLDATPRPGVESALRKLQGVFPPPVDLGWPRQPTTPQPLAPLLTPLADQLR
jgi:hypothetical protein